VTTLNAYGADIVDVLTHREVTTVAAPIHSAMTRPRSHRHAHRRRAVRRGDGLQLGAAHIVCGPHVHRGSNIHYYAVDHSSSLLWKPATWEISQALLPHLRTVLGGPGVWDSNQTIRRAIEIRAGIIQNPNILSFQHRAAQYPHPRLQ